MNPCTVKRDNRLEHTYISKVSKHENIRVELGLHVAYQKAQPQCNKKIVGWILLLAKVAAHLTSKNRRCCRTHILRQGVVTLYSIQKSPLSGLSPNAWESEIIVLARSM